LSNGSILGPSPNDSDLKIEVVDHLAQELAAAKKWFDEREPKVRPGQRQRYPGQAGSTTDVRDPSVGIQEFRNRRTIQYVAIPHAIHFTWPEQPALHTGAGQNLGVALGSVHRGSEEGLGCSRRRGHLSCFT
jgi:hypothetical protein